MRIVETVGNKETSLNRLNIYESFELSYRDKPLLAVEDDVIYHDSSTLLDFNKTESDWTGRALFERGNDQLEVYTANRKPLEHLFGVDLIYLNLTKHNIVMLQYKMLESENDDWIYRPDKQLDIEIERMNKFSKQHPVKPEEYRLNPDVFYLKFARRDGSLSKGGIIMPVEHFEKVRNTEACIGPRGGIRVSYNSLAGRYIRETPFLDLIRSGYIGAYATKTIIMKALVKAVLKGDRAVVAAIQQSCWDE